MDSTVPKSFRVCDKSWEFEGAEMGVPRLGSANNYKYKSEDKWLTYEGKEYRYGKDHSQRKSNKRHCKQRSTHRTNF